MRSEALRTPWDPVSHAELTRNLKSHIITHFCEPKGMPRWTWQYIEDALQNLFMDQNIQRELNNGVMTTSRLQNAAVNKFIDTLRNWQHMAKTKNASQADAHEALRDASQSDNFINEIMLIDCTREVIDYLEQQRLQGKRWADVFIRFWFNGQAYLDITREAGFSSATIRSDLKNALRLLREKFADST